VIENHYTGKIFEKDALVLFDSIEKFLKGCVINDIDADDIMIGHSYFMAKTQEELEFKKVYEIKPLLEEYRKDGIINAKKEDIDALFPVKVE
jgi:5-methylcytosine-specific restriction protein B